MKRILRIGPIVVAVLVVLAGCAGWTSEGTEDEAATSSGSSPVAGPPIGDVPTYRSDARRSGVMPGPLPDQKPAKLWQLGKGMRATDPPTVADGVVYVPATEAEARRIDEPPPQGVLYALDAVTGSERWQVKLGGVIWSPPTIADGSVYIGSEDGSLVALDATDGNERWRVEAGPVMFAPAVVEHVVYVLGGTTLQARDARDGTELWSYDTQGTEPVHPASGTLAVSNGVVVIVTQTGELVAVNTKTGAEQWRVYRGYEKGPAIGNGLAFAVSNSTILHAVDVSSGIIVWAREFPDSILAPPAVTENFVFIHDFQGTVHALDAQSGDVRWTAKVAGRWEFHFPGAPVVIDDAVLVSAGGNLIALDAATGKERWRVAGEGELTATGGIIFAAEDDLVAYGDPDRR